VKASVEQNCVTVLKQIQLSSHRCFIHLPTALFDGVMCVFRAQNNKSNDLYLLVMAHCNRRTRNWTRQTLGTCPQCAVRREQVNTEISKPSSLRKTCMDRFLLKLKDTRSVSSHEAGLLYRIPVTLRQQQQCRKFASARRYVTLATSWTVRGSNPGGRRDFLHPSKPALGPTQPPVEWEPGLSRG